MPELGIPRATLQQLQEYATQQFTKENAVLWLSGPPPADLRLDLPQGAKRPVPPLSLAQGTFPCWYLDDACGGVGVGATVPRVAGSTAFQVIALRRLHEQLRTSQAISYSPSLLYEPLTADTGHLVLYADSDGQRREELVDAFAEVFVGLSEIEASEFEAARDQILEGWTGALGPAPGDREVLEVQRAAADWILGMDFEPIEHRATELQSVTRDDVTAFHREMASTALFALPRGVSLHPCFGEQASVSMNPSVRGRVIRCVDAPRRTELLTYGPDGVSLLYPDNSHCTVRYSELAAALYYEDGAVCLIGNDAATVTVEPTLWRDGKRVCQQIRERVPAHQVVDVISRPPDAIPRPTTKPWQRLLARLSGH